MGILYFHQSLNDVFQNNFFCLFVMGKMKSHSFNLRFLLLMSQYFVCYFQFMLLVLIILFKPFLWNRKLFLIQKMFGLVKTQFINNFQNIYLVNLSEMTIEIKTIFSNM